MMGEPLDIYGQTEAGKRSIIESGNGMREKGVNNYTKGS